MIQPISDNVELLMNLLQHHFGNKTIDFYINDAEVDNGFVNLKNAQIVGGSGVSLNFRINLTELMTITKQTKADELELQYNSDIDYVEISKKESGAYCLETV